MFGSIDANRGDPQNGWDTDQFPNSVDELAMPLYEIMRAGGFTPAASTSTPSCAARASDRTDLFHAHIGGIDTLAMALLVAADDRGRGRSRRCARSATPAGRRARTVDPRWRLRSTDLAARVAAGEIEPQPVSGRQEQLENVVNRRHLVRGRPRRDRRGR